MHVKTRNKQFNDYLKAWVGKAFGKHPATLTREEARATRTGLSEALSGFKGIKTLDLKNECKALEQALTQKVEE